MHYNCLIVDDEEGLAKVTCEYFQMFDTSCTYVTSARQCEEFLASQEVDVILLDINLADESGFSLCKKIRETYTTPILFISARQSDDDILIALNIGGDDYIKKPYSLSVLLAKVKVILKRIQNSEVYEAGKKREAKVGEDQDTEEISYKNIRINEGAMKIYIGEKEILLKAKEFKLFLCLFQNRNKIVTKDQLFSEVWGDSFFSDGTINVHIRRLREKIEEDPNHPQLIKTIWGTGYMLEV
ncbi:response regulator transcription factor [Anaerosporobacter faecicola]|uniref:response regulator transcription factor n=1 Tax=Anaerosporobacter faecicola TaxID=2718714 RepID=UPI001439D326|nr:response regulator transcription factor [Anaerosporobacter faecicola]